MLDKRYFNFMLFRIPAFPEAALGYIIGLVVRMNLRTFMAVSRLARLFGTALFSLSGSHAGRQNHIPAAAVTLSIILPISLLIIYHCLYAADESGSGRIMFKIPSLGIEDSPESFN